MLTKEQLANVNAQLSVARDNLGDIYQAIDSAHDETHEDKNGYPYSADDARATNLLEEANRPLEKLEEHLKQYNTKE